jgi:hypothetical protein
MKILLINQSFVPPDEPGHTRHFEMAQYLRKCGHEMVIVASDSITDRSCAQWSGKGLYVEQMIGGIRALCLQRPDAALQLFWALFHF